MNIQNDHMMQVVDYQQRYRGGQISGVKVHATVSPIDRRQCQNSEEGY